MAKMKKAYKKHIMKTKKKKRHDDSENEDNAKLDNKQMAKLLKAMQEPSGTADLGGIADKDETIKAMAKKMEELQRKVEAGAAAAAPGRSRADGGPRLRVPQAFTDRVEAPDDEGEPATSQTALTVAKQILPDTDMTDWPKDEKTFLKRLSDVPKLTQAILNSWLKDQGLSESTGTSKLTKIEQLVTYLKTKDA